MRIEDIVDDYWMRQLANFFNRRGRVNSSLRTSRHVPNSVEDELDDQVTTASDQNFHNGSDGFDGPPESAVSTYDNAERLLMDD